MEIVWHFKATTQEQRKINVKFFIGQKVTNIQKWFGNQTVKKYNQIKWINSETMGIKDQRSLIKNQNKNQINL